MTAYGRQKKRAGNDTMKRMLINATQPEELRVATVDGQKLHDLDVESPGQEQKKSNIYKGRITRIEPSLEAAFVDYGADRHGFLPLKEVSRSYFVNQPEKGRPSIRDVLKEGQELILQIEKEERGNKGAALTTFISLAGRYLVLMPNNPRAGGVSRRIEGEDRNALREAMSVLEIPEGMGLIVRTAGVGRQAEELQWDLDYLLHLWGAIDRSAEAGKAPFLIFQESNIIIRAIRDNLRSDIAEVLIDDPKVHRQAYQFMEQVMPHNLSKIKLYEDDVPLFNRYQIESQIETAFQREVRLPSGGAIVIDPTEALTSIDVNSARATKGSDIEETALNTNLEAADEIARQLRLRDTGGLLVIDFIDMTPTRNQRAVENRLRDALKVDRARVQIGRISRFGLLEMSRQRLRPSLSEASQQTCPRCSGQGSVRDVRSMALSILRILEEDAMKTGTGRLIAQVPVGVATYLLNEKRDSVIEIESRHRIRIVLIPNPDMDTPAYDIQRVREADVDIDDDMHSHDLPSAADPVADTPSGKPPKIQREVPTVRDITPQGPAPTPMSAPASPQPQIAEATPAPGEHGFLRRLIGNLFTTPTATTTSTAAAEDSGQTEPEKPASGSGSRGRGERDGNNARGGNRSGQSKRRRGPRKKQTDENTENKTQGQTAKTTAGNTNAKVATADDADGEGEGEGEGKKRSRRGGRRRRRGGRGSGQGSASTEQSTQNAEVEQTGQQTQSPTEKTTDSGADSDRPAKKPERKRPPRNKNAQTVEAAATDAPTPAAAKPEAVSKKLASENKTDTPKPAAAKSESVVEIKPAAAKSESTVETKPAPAKSESAVETKPAPAKSESVVETKPAPAKSESAVETKPAPAVRSITPKPVQVPKADDVKPTSTVTAGKADTKPEAKAAPKPVEPRPAAKQAEPAAAPKKPTAMVETKKPAGMIETKKPNVNPE
jgi:ribonuclease E